MNTQLPLTVCAFGVLLVSACSTSNDHKPAPAYGASATTSAASAATNATGPAHVMTAQNSLGTILTDGAGRALYLFAADTGSTSTCTGDCAREWPPLTTNGAPVAGAGADPALLSTTARPDGTTQLTYHGHPLYYYDDDKGPGTAEGQGEYKYGAKWYVLDPAGNEVEKS